MWNALEEAAQLKRCCSAGYAKPNAESPSIRVHLLGPAARRGGLICFVFLTYKTPFRDPAARGSSSRPARCSLAGFYDCITCSPIAVQLLRFAGPRSGATALYGSTLTPTIVQSPGVHQRAGGSFQRNMTEQPLKADSM
jgi:hypothetical protein